ncbi:hypothetical protein PFISCL1PPCAC_7057 [Pristionchus fissidentatus]|uniref:Uncharacterized protein n=1 Tax=Pristionchus fissidentatus TaxID=1538716 RepID=A0AAV5VB29_9BILA|nr:hypothetical protein PFISCL1PPCAC_7057 [Pristionchus fissidentatus]
MSCAMLVRRTLGRIRGRSTAVPFARRNTRLPEKECKGRLPICSSPPLVNTITAGNATGAIQKSYC